MNKNHSEKVYLFGVVFLCAILPYFMAFASTFFREFYTKCTKEVLFSKGILFENRLKWFDICEIRWDRAYSKEWL